MNIKLILKNILYISITVFLTGLVVFTITNAGSLSPTLSPASTFYTLADIYTRLTTNATATESNHNLSTSSPPSATNYTLKQIYDAIPTIDATRVLAGTSYLGVAGNALANMWNGTSGIYAGGSQANGGADDYNNGGQPPVDRYSGTWTQCTVDNNYCGTGDSGADAKDNSTNLVWSMPCNGVGCTSFSDSTPLTYSWSNGGGNNNSLTAQQLCSQGDHGSSGWSLPHQKQLLQAYIDGAYSNLEATGLASRNYLSATTRYYDTTYAWTVGICSGYGAVVVKTNSNSNYIRCVRTAP